MLVYGPTNFDAMIMILPIKFESNQDIKIFPKFHTIFWNTSVIKKKKKKKKKKNEHLGILLARRPAVKATD